MLAGFAASLLTFLARFLWLFVPSPHRFAAWIAVGALALWSVALPLRLWRLLLTRRDCDRGLWPLLSGRRF